MTALPVWMYIEGTTYHFKEWECTNGSLKGWWACGLYSNDWPAEVKDRNGNIYYLCSVKPTKEESHKSLLEKINNMK